MKLFRSLGLALVILATVITATPAAMASGPSISVTPDISSVHVSWTGGGFAPGMKYVVQSTPGRFKCVTTIQACDIALSATYPTLTFRVALMRPNDTAVWRSPASKVIKTTHLVVIAGQSNATGMGAAVSSNNPNFNLWQGKTASAADSGVSIQWSGCDLRNSGSVPVKLKTPQTKNATPHTAVFGPEVGFARGLWKSGWRNIVINKVTCGGTDIASYWAVGSPLYVQLLLSTRALQNYELSRGVVAVMSAALWMQGENDILIPGLADGYHDAALALIRATRAASTVVNFPIGVGLVDVQQFIAATSYTNGACVSSTCQESEAANARVRSAQRGLVHEVPNLFVVETADLLRNGSDHIHLTSQSELTLGERFATAFLTVAKK